MSHTPEVIETKELSDEEIGYRIRCCGDPSSDSWHGISVFCPTAQDPRTHDQQLVERKDYVAAKHEAKVRWRKAQADAQVQASA